MQPLDTLKPIPGGGFKDPIYKARWGFDHLGVDYYAEYVPVYAHLDGDIIQEQWGKEGGWWLMFRGKDGYIIRSAHHKEYKKPLGHYTKGTVLAITGNTGTHRDGTPNAPHWHCEVINPLGARIDPEWYFNQPNNIIMDYSNSIIRNIDTGGFYFFKKSKQFEMARQPLSSNTVGFALLTLKQIWKDKDYEHIYQMNSEKLKEYAIVWEFFGGEDQSFIDANK